MMTNEEFFDEPANVVATMDDGDFIPQQVTWQTRKYRITAVGRQWDETGGRHMLVEANDGTRFELQLRREDFSWRVKRVWRAPAVA